MPVDITIPLPVRVFMGMGSQVWLRGEKKNPGITPVMPYSGLDCGPVDMGPVCLYIELNPGPLDSVQSSLVRTELWTF